MTNIFLYKGDNNTVIESGVVNKPNIIYMDPPYNTWNSSLLYKDSKNKTSWREEFTRLIKNIHTISQENSVLFISIGVEELANVITVSEEVYGKKSIVTVMPRRVHSGHKTTKTISLQHDFVVVVKKGDIEFNGVDYVQDSYNKEDEYFSKRGKYQLRRIDYKDFKWSESLDCSIELEGQTFYPGGVSKTNWNIRKKEHNTNDWAWIWSNDLIQFAHKNGFVEIKNGRLWKKTYTKAKIVKNKETKEYEIKYFKRTKKVNSLNFVDKAYATKNKKNELEALFTYPKSDELLIDLLKLPNFKEKIVLDPFGGTGTTAIASCNKKVNAKEVHIIQLDEKTSEDSAAYKDGYKTIYKLTKENIEKRTNKKVKEIK